jgi:hypothetical protein
VQETTSLWKEREVIFGEFWEAAGSRPAAPANSKTCHLDWHRIPEPFGCQKVTDWITPAMPTSLYQSGQSPRSPFVDTFIVSDTLLRCRGFTGHESSQADPDRTPAAPRDIPSTSFCRVPLKQASVGSGQCHPNSIPFSRQHGRGIPLTTVSLPLP